MMYNNKLAAAIKVDGKVLREFKDTVYLKFGSEYSILLKNLHSQRAVVNVYIDGENAVPGGIVIRAGAEVTLERTVRSNNLDQGNRFKFIERTSAIDEHRGVKLEDGLIRIEFQFEEPTNLSSININDNIFYKNLRNNQTMLCGTVTLSAQYNVNGIMRGVDFSKGFDTASRASAAIDQYCADNNIANASMFVDGMAATSWQNDSGITVPGSVSNQKFSTTSVGKLESQVHTMVFKLLGDLGNNKPVTESVTVSYKPECITCGKKNSATAKFCSSCGTALEVFV